MENKAKIAYCLLSFLFLFVLSSCVRTKQGTGYFLIVSPKKATVLRIYQASGFYKKGPFEVRFVKMKDSLYNIADIVDCKTFMNIYDGDDSIARGNNLYYNINPILNYFKDKRYIYCYDNSRDSLYDNFLTVLGKSDDYKVLGGAYLQIGDKIYCKGKEVEGADATSFQTIEVLQKDSEWPVVMGKDDKNFYLYDKPITQNQSELFF